MLGTQLFYPPMQNVLTYGSRYTIKRKLSEISTKMHNPAKTHEPIVLSKNSINIQFCIINSSFPDSPLPPISTSLWGVEGCSWWREGLGTWAFFQSLLLCVPRFIIPGGCMWECSYVGMCMYMCASGCQHSCQDLHNNSCTWIVQHIAYLYIQCHHTCCTCCQHHLIPRPMQKQLENGWSPWQHPCKCRVSKLPYWKYLAWSRMTEEFL